MISKRFKVALVAAAIVLGGLAFLATLRAGPSGAQQGSMLNCPQAGKWAIAVWAGDSGATAADALVTCGADAVAAAYSLDAQTQAWSRWFADKPEVSNLAPLNDKQGVLALGGAAPIPGPSPVVTATLGTGGERIFYDGFNSLDNWDTSAYRQLSWELDYSECESPPCARMRYRNDEWAYLQHAFTLPDASPITLRFKVWYLIEPGYDYASVSVNHQGIADDAELVRYSGSSSGFEQGVADLSSYAGESIVLYFEFYTDYRDAIAEGGVRIDDVEVRVGGQPAPPSPTLTVEPLPETVVTRSECEQVQLGMTYDQVVSIVGAEGEYEGMTNAWGYDSFTWMNPNGSNMVLWFRDGVLQSKSPCDYTFPER